MDRHLKFVWGASKVIKGQWYLGLVGFYDRQPGLRWTGIALSVRGMLAWGALVAALGWVALATAVYSVWQRNPYAELTFADALCYPLRRSSIAEKKSQAFIAQGLDFARAGKWFDAANLLRLGLERGADNQRGRLTLAQIYQQTNQRDLAMQALAAGLGEKYPGRTYLEAVFHLASSGEDWEVVITTSTRYLIRLPKAEAAMEYRWLMEQRHAALMSAQRYEEARALAEAEGTGEDAMERRAFACLALQRLEDAAALLAAWRLRPGADLRRVCRLEVRTFQESRRFADLERSLDELKRRSPGEAGPWGYAVVQYTLAGRDADAAAAMKAFLFRFVGSEDALAELLGPLSEVGNLALLEQGVAAAREQGYPLARFLGFQLNALVRKGEWEAAQRTFDVLPPLPEKDRSGRVWREWVRVLIGAARTPAEAAQHALVDFLKGRAWGMEMFRQSVGAMQRAGRVETAREIMELGRRAFPANPWLRQSLAEFSPRLPEPAPVVTQMPEAQNVFARRLDYLVRRRNWDEAAQHLAQVRALQPAPGWLPRVEAVMREAEARIAQSRGDLPALRRIGTAWWRGNGAAVPELLGLATEFAAGGDAAAALALTRDWAGHAALSATAKESLAEWERRDATAGADAAASTDVLLLQLRQRQSERDGPGILRLAGRLLTGDSARAEQAVRLARDWAAAGDPSAARILINEVVRRQEGLPSARLLQAELGSSPARKE